MEEALRRGHSHQRAVSQRQRLTGPGQSRQQSAVSLLFLRSFHFLFRLPFFFIFSMSNAASSDSTGCAPDSSSFSSSSSSDSAPLSPIDPVARDSTHTIPDAACKQRLGSQDPVVPAESAPLPMTSCIEWELQEREKGVEYASARIGVSGVPPRFTGLSAVLLSVLQAAPLRAPISGIKVRAWTVGISTFITARDAPHGQADLVLRAELPETGEERRQGWAFTRVGADTRMLATDADAAEALSEAVQDRLRAWHMCESARPEFLCGLGVGVCTENDNSFFGPGSCVEESPTRDPLNWYAGCRVYVRGLRTGGCLYQPHDSLFIWSCSKARHRA